MLVLHPFDVSFHRFLYNDNIVVLFADLGAEATLRDLEVRLASVALLLGLLLLFVLLISLSELLSIASGKLSSRLRDCIVRHKLRLASHSVHEVALFVGREVSQVQALPQAVFHTPVFLHQFDLSLIYAHHQRFLLNGRALTDREVEQQIVVLNRFHSCAVDVHFVPGAVDDTLSEHLKLQVRLLGLFSDVVADVVALLDELGLLREVDYKFITFQFLDCCNGFVVVEKSLQLVLNTAKLLHYLLAEYFLFLGVCLLELFLHDISEKLHIGYLQRLKFLEDVHLIRRGDRDRLLRELRLLVDSDHEN